MGRRRARPSDTDAWWGEGPPPWERWSGTSLELDDCGGRYWFDAEAADRACDFFPTYLRHVKGEFAGRPFELLPWQRDLIMRPLFGWKRANGTRRFRKAFLEVGKKNGKALKVDAPIPTPSGWTTMGELRPGDQVLGAGGEPVRVLAATDVMHGHECFRVCFSDASEIVADAHHLWLTEAHNEGGRAAVRTTMDIARSLEHDRSPNHLVRGRGPHATPRAIVAVEPVPSVPVRCIQVAAPGGLFLAGEGMVPTHNSGLASGVGLLLAFGDAEPGAEVYAAAADREQARIVFGDAAVMARENPDFLRDAAITVLRNAIVQTATNSTFKAVSSEVGTKHGFNVHGLIFDEFHTQRTRDLYDTLYKGTSARRQPLVFIITTAGDDRESICYEEYEYAKKVRDGVIEDEQYLPVIFESQPDADWTEERTWHASNPSLGVTKSLEYMRAECAAAQAEPRKRNSFLRLELNHWTESRTVWIAPESWEACRREEPATDLAMLPCCAGLDLSASADLTAIVLAFRRRDQSRAVETLDVETKESDAPAVQRRLVLDFEVELVPYFFLPRDVLHERARKDRVPYDVWAREGWLRVTEGNVVDYGEIYRVLLDEIRPRFKGLSQVGYDPWNASHLASSLMSAGVPMVEVRQGYASLSGPSKLFEALVRSRRIRHDGNPVMRWCAANCEVTADPAGNIKPVKPGGAAQGTRRIDGIVAAVIALSRLMVAPDGPASPYAHRGVRTVG